jgi:hypothetical protein
VLVAPARRRQPSGTMNAHIQNPKKSSSSPTPTMMPAMACNPSCVSSVSTKATHVTVMPAVPGSMNAW